MNDNRYGYCYAVAPIKPVLEEEKIALEKCDKILEGVQDYLRGATNVQIIRNYIKSRLEGYL